MRFLRWLDWRWAAPLLACLLAGGLARAETPIMLFKSFAGNVNFTGTQKTMRTRSNSINACSVVSASTVVKATLTGIPAGATVLNAQLYWAASGSNPDYTITFEGSALSAPATRQYALSVDSYDYFGAAADVTAQVVAKRNGDYSMTGLNIDSGSPYCDNETVLGGFQLLVIYSLPTEAFRVLNVYEGFQIIQNSSLSLTLSNFLIPNPIGSANGRIGAITWEGDDTLSGNAEHLRFNNVEMSDGSMNVSGNQFNSASNINNDSASYGIDFDAFTVKSPVILSGQTQATTYYSSGQDRVLLNAEIIAAPNVPATDRAIAMRLNSTLNQSQTTSYTLTVSNNGPMSETALRVTDTLPPVFIVVSAGGTGWSCNIAGQTVTCNYGGDLAMGATPAPITIVVTVAANASGSVTNSATVSGALYDYYDANNTASVSAIVGGALFAPTYAFTDKVCVHNQPFGSAAQPCIQVSVPPSMSNADIGGLFITYLVAGVPTSLGSSNTNVSMKFAVTCHNPTTTAGQTATFTSAGGTLPTCTPNGLVPPNQNSAWSKAANVVFPGGSPTVNVNNFFRYPDVGRIELFMSDSSYRLGSSGPFVSRPGNLTLVAAAGAASNQAALPAVAATPKFVAAGAPFSLTLTALTGGLTPQVALNFGRESPPAALYTLTSAASDATGATFAPMLNVPQLTGSFGAVSAGVAKGNGFAFADVGIIQVTPALVGADYLGSGNVSGIPINVGRFVPDHFDTSIVAPFACPTPMACPATVSGMAYSGQGFKLDVTARNVAGATTVNYSGVFARAVALTAWNAAGGASQNPPASPSGSVLAPAALADSAFAGGVGSTSASYTFPRAYSAAATRASNLVAPTGVYLRAVESSGDGVTSLDSTPVEGGVMVASGRLLLSNAYGSELLRMPISMQSQYFLNGGWSNNPMDTGPNASTVTGPPAFSRCTGNLLVGGICKLAALSVNGSATLSGGSGRLFMAAPGGASNGSVDVTMQNPAWLPSTKARLVFGLYRSPLIYIRELY